MLGIFKRSQIAELQQELVEIKSQLAEIAADASSALKSSTEELTAANLRVAQLKLELACMEQAHVAPKRTWHLNSAGTVAVSDIDRFLPIDESTPRGAKMQLLGPGGSAVISVYNGENFWKGWAPLPGTGD